MKTEPTICKRCGLRHAPQALRYQRNVYVDNGRGYKIWQSHAVSDASGNRYSVLGGGFDNVGNYIAAHLHPWQGDRQSFTVPLCQVEPS